MLLYVVRLVLFCSHTTPEKLKRSKDLIRLFSGIHVAYCRGFLARTQNKHSHNIEPLLCLTKLLRAVIDEGKYKSVRNIHANIGNS